MAVVDYTTPLRSIDREEPVLEPGHALLDVQTCGVCATDLKIVAGRMPFSNELRLPHVPGHEIFARVVRTEPPELVAAGARVVVYQYGPCRRCASCLRGDEVLCLDMRAWLGFVDPGGFQERIVAPVDRLIEVPTTVSAVEAAPLSCAVGTAYRSVVSRAAVRSGDAVAVIGLGGVGIHAAQVAVAAGASVIGLDVRDAALDAAVELGVRTIRADDPDAARAMLTEHPTGVDAVIDTVATDETTELAIEVIRRGGRIVDVGHGPATRTSIPTRRLVLDEIQVMGSRYATRHEMARAIALVGQGRVRPIVGLTRPLDRAQEALDALANGEFVGRAVIDVAGVT